MPTAIQNRTFSNNGPCMFPDKAAVVGIRLPGGVNIAAMSVLGITNVAKGNAVQTLVATAAVGTFTLASDGVVSAPLNPNTLLAATVQAQMDAIIGAGNCVVTGSTNGAGTGSFVITFAGEYASANIALLALVNTLGSGTLTISTTTVGSPGKGLAAALYNNGAADGSQTGKLLLKNNVQTDAKGALKNEFGVPSQVFTTEAWITGHFLASDIPNIDATNVLQLGKISLGNLVTDQGCVIRLL